MRIIALMILFLFYSVSQTKHFILISPPGSGKGTFSQYFVETYGYVHICPGDIFRAEIRAGTHLGKEIQPIVERGDYVDEQIVCDLIAQKIDHVLLNDQQFILDGFPRSLYSYDFLQSYLTGHNLIDQVIFVTFKVDDSICKERILTRLICPACSKVYNLVGAKPQVLDRCDACQCRLISREGDTSDIIIKRLHYFHENIAFLFDKAKMFYCTHEINADQAIDDVRKEYAQLVI